jgi:nicotinamidase-related amidase
MTSRKALFVIDIQKELAADPKTRVPHYAKITQAGEAILKAARAFVDSYRNKNESSPLLIVFVQHEESADGGGTLVRDTEPWRLVFEPRADVEEEILVSKHTGT